MKRGRKTTISTQNISRELISHKEQIIQNNILMKSSNIIWQQLITKYNWNITPKALWTRIFKYSPNYDKFFESESQNSVKRLLYLLSMIILFLMNNYLTVITMNVTMKIQ